MRLMRKWTRPCTGSRFPIFALGTFFICLTGSLLLLRSLDVKSLPLVEQQAQQNECMERLIEEKWSAAATLDPNKENMEEASKFHNFFMPHQVTEFLCRYNTICHPNALLLGSLFDEYDLGFAAFLNNALGNFLLATYPVTQAEYRFQIVFHKWRYAALPYFFDDLGKDAGCPFYLHLETGNQTSELASLRGARNSLLNMVQKGDLVVRVFSRAWTKTREIVDELTRHDGLEEIFERKSILAKILWQPNHDLKKLLYSLWRQLTNDTGNYVGIHIRRGDKVLSQEMKDIPIRSYFEKLHRVSSKPCSVLVMTDDYAAYDEFLLLANGTKTKVYNLLALAELLGLPKEPVWARSPAETYKIPLDDRITWFKVTKQLILEITLLSMADQIICTMTSNVCRLAALLKRSYEKDVHGLDGGWFPL